MGVPPVGKVVIVAFPYADFTKVKNRPALIVGLAEFSNLIACQITSQRHTSKTAINISDKDFSSGSLHADSFARPDKLFTLEAAVIQREVGAITDQKLKKIKTAIRQLFE